MSTFLRSSNAHALKEWAVVCDSLAQGSQRLLFRKGGIHEGPQGFVPEQPEFWLFPTGFHQASAAVRPEFRLAAEQVLNHPPAAGEVPLSVYCTIRAIRWIEDAAVLEQLSRWQVLTIDALLQRFHYRQPGLFVLWVDAWQLPQPVVIPDDPRYAGCRSWVTLNEEISTRQLQPVGPGQGNSAGSELSAWFPAASN